MFAGKSEEVIRRGRIASEVAGHKVLCFRPAMDNRYSTKSIASYTGSRLDAHLVRNTPEIEHVEATHGPAEVYIFDELQFFDEGVINFILTRANRGARIIAGLLDLNFRAEPFTFMNSKRHVGELFPYADITTLRALCLHKGPDGKQCNAPADYTQRMIDGKPASYDSPLVLVGSTESYTVRCGNHHSVPGKPQSSLFFFEIDKKKIYNLTPENK